MGIRGTYVSALRRIQKYGRSDPDMADGGDDVFLEWGSGYSWSGYCKAREIFLDEVYDRSMC